jgi:hypothetical protein
LAGVVAKKDPAMTVSAWLRDNWVDRVRQYGVGTALRQMARALIRPVVQTDRELVLAKPDRNAVVQDEWPEIHTLSPEVVAQAEIKGAITGSLARRLRRFLAEGCWGFMAQVDESFAGYAFIQPCGTYTFGPGGRFEIPSNMVVLKNLFVFSDFRGYSLGKKFNQARLAAVPTDRIPAVFVMCENRYAVRNLRLAGFEEMLQVTLRRWFGRWVSQRVCVLSERSEAYKLAEGFRRTRAGDGAGN